MIKKTIYILLLLAFTLMGAGAAGAQSLNREQVLSGLSAKYRDINSLKADYRRVASTPTTGQIFQSSASQEARGVLSWQKPDKLLLDQASPAPELMLTDGHTVWWHIPAEKLAYRYRNIDVAGQLKPLLSFLGGLNSLNAEFNVALAPADKGRPGHHGLVLTPKGGPEGGVERLTVWCDGSFALTGFRLSSITGETTDFYFSGFSENPKLPNSLFSFKVPRGTEVIEE